MCNFTVFASGFSEEVKVQTYSVADAKPAPGNNTKGEITLSGSTTIAANSNMYYNLGITY